MGAILVRAKDDRAGVSQQKKERLVSWSYQEKHLLWHEGHRFSTAHGLEHLFVRHRLLAT